MKRNVLAKGALFLIFTWRLAVGATPDATPNRAATPPGSGAPERVREGTRIFQTSGLFQSSGDRVTFISETLPPLRVLENLALERVVQTQAERGANREWSVNGVITEYRGVNYLLLSRASLKIKRPD